MEKTAKDRGAWLDRVTNGRIDIAMAVVLLAFFYYKGGLRLVSILVFTFVSLVALFHLIVVPSSKLFRRYSRYRNRAKQGRIPPTSEPEPGDQH